VENNAHMLTVGDFVLNIQSRKLFDQNNKEISLPPTLFTLLKFFIDHQGQVLSRETIINNVWKGKVVVDANVNQNIKKLRDVLGDAAADPRYIETVTGEGFRFIANSSEYKSSPGEGERFSKTTKAAYGVASLILLLTLIYFQVFQSDPKNQIKELKPLTTLKGLEHYPEVTPDKKYLLFNHKNGKSWDIYIKPLDRESYHALVDSDEDELFPTISHDQRRLAYFLRSNTKCGLYMREIDLNALHVGKEVLIKPCEISTERIKAAWINDNELFVSINKDFNSPASIYRFDIKNRTQSIISKPADKGFGDYAFRYSQKQNKLAYIRDIGWTSSEIWVFNLNNQSHNKIKSTPLMLRGLDWDDEGRIYFQSGNKSLSRIDFDGRDEEVVARFFADIFVPFNINKNSFGVVTGDFFVTDVKVFNFDNKSSELVVSSSSNDYFGAGGSEFVAFVSNRSGDPQVWVRDANGINKQITSYEESFELKWLSVSIERGLIMFNKSGFTNIIDTNGNLVFDSENYSSRIHNNPVFDLSRDQIIYSVLNDGDWNIEARKLSAFDERAILLKGKVARPCPESNCYFFFKERDPFIYRYRPGSNFSEKIAEIGNIGESDEWDLMDDETILYLSKGKNTNRIIEHQLDSHRETILLESDVRMFSLNEEKTGIYMNVVSQGNVDMRYFDL